MDNSSIKKKILKFKDKLDDYDIDNWNYWDYKCDLDLVKFKEG